MKSANPGLAIEMCLIDTPVLIFKISVGKEK